MSDVRAKVGDLKFNPFWALYIREMKRFLKVIFQTVFTPLINATLYLLIFGLSLGKNIHLDGGLSYLAFLIPGLVMMSVLNNAFQNSSSSIVAGRFAGDLEDLKVVPLSSNQIIWALSIAGLCRGLVVGIITFLVGEIFYFIIEHSFLGIANPLALIFFLIGGGLIFAQLGITVAFWAKSFDQVSAVGSFILVPLIYLGGVFFSLKGLHPFWLKISEFNPVLYLINGVRFGLLGRCDVDIQLATAICVVTLVVFYLLALRALKQGNFTRW